MNRRTKALVGLVAVTLGGAILTGACAGSASGSEPVNTDPKVGWVQVFPDGDSFEGIYSQQMIERCDPYIPGLLHIQNSGGTPTQTAVMGVEACLTP
jgi:hypothetical protein